MDIEFDIENSLGFIVNKVHQIFSFKFKEKLSPFNITPPQFATLAFLWKNDGLSQVQISNDLKVDRTTISGIIDRLEKEKLVLRKNHPDDRRTHLIYLTDKGKDLKNVLPLLSIKNTREITKKLTTHEIKILETLLFKIIINNEQ